MSLRTALEKAQLVWNAQQKHPAHIETVINTIGYTKKTGPSLRAISALNQYGLTKETGSVDSRVIGLSDLAINYLLSDDPQQRGELLRQAALKPTVFQHLWEQYGAFLPPNDDAIKSHLIREKNFNAAAVGELVANYRDTFDFANLSGNGGEREKTEIDTKKTTPPISTGIPPVVAQKRKESELPLMTQGLRYLSIPLEIGDAPVPLGMSKKDWEIFINTLKIWKGRIVNSSEETREADKALEELGED
jgi:hypothetical protein